MITTEEQPKGDFAPDGEVITTSFFEQTNFTAFLPVFRGIATGKSGIESRTGEIFRARQVRPWGPPCLFRGSEADWGVMLSTFPLPQVAVRKMQ